MIEKIIILVISIISIILIIYWILKFEKGAKEIVKTFQKGNVIVTGHKGHGKDLLFSFVINERENKRKPEYAYSNTKYTEQTEIKKPKDFNISPNTYENFLNGKIIKIKKILEEKKDYYLADAGLYLPSQYQGELVKKYPSLPLFYALQRQLLQSNFHCNVQNLERLWDKIREQADYYIECVDNVRIPFTKIFIQKLIYYDRYQGAKERVRPFKVDQRLLGKDKTQQALKKDYECKYGTVKYLYILNKLNDNPYDTRIFHEIIYGEKAPNEQKRKLRLGKSTNKEIIE